MTVECITLVNSVHYTLLIGWLYRLEFTLGAGDFLLFILTVTVKKLAKIIFFHHTTFGAAQNMEIMRKSKHKIKSWGIVTQQDEAILIGSTFMLRYLKLLELINKDVVTLAKGEANSGRIQGGDNGGRSQGGVSRRCQGGIPRPNPVT